MLPYDDILKFVIGEFGTYQKFCFFLLCLSAIPIGMWTVSPVFLHADTDHWCKVPESNVITSTCIAYNVSDDCPRFTKDLTIPKEKYQNGCTSEWKYSNCYAYDRNITMENLLLGDFGFLNTSDVVECQHGWEYDATRTTVNQEVWDLFGRMTSLIIAVSTLVVFSLLEGLAPSFALFAIGRVTAGASRYGIYSQVFVLSGSLLWFRITFFMIGKFGVAVTYAIVWIYMAELYPTTVRSIGVSITCISGMLGATFAPQVLLLSNLWEPLPMIVIAVLQLTAGVLALLLPETRGKKLPETIEEGEAFGRKKPTKEKDCKRSNAVKPGQIIKISSVHMSKTKEDLI
ncbi:carcinine transporter-like [Glandiceps talaboti]